MAIATPPRADESQASGDAIMISTPDLEPQPSAAEAANPVVEADLAAAVGRAARRGRPKRRRINLGMDRFSGLYVWAALIILFSFWVPDTFPTTDNAKIIAGDQAITAMLALGIIIPLAAGVFDLSFAGVLGVSVAIVATCRATVGMSGCRRSPPSRRERSSGPRTGLSSSNYASTPSSPRWV